MSSVRQKRNKPENPFQNYDLAIKLFRSTKEIFLYKKYFNATIRSTKNWKPERKLDPGLSRKFLLANELVSDKKYFYIRFFLIQPSEVQGVKAKSAHLYYIAL